MKEADCEKDLATISSLDELASLLSRRRGLYVRWSRGPRADLPAPSSRDDLTGVELPGLSANPLDLEEWWGERPLRTWAARRLFDYSHLPRVRNGCIRPWLLHGTEAGRGPDNEPLVRNVAPLGWIHESVIAEAEQEIKQQQGLWGPLDRLQHQDPTAQPRGKRIMGDAQQPQARRSGKGAATPQDSRHLKAAQPKKTGKEEHEQAQTGGPTPPEQRPDHP
ncbi:DUF6098 family protein [Streptomyces sp. NRRL S-87]|uniref:DUF6098 family protein n=1 Tax=Streptomyces sp. NRRL S-87 TaxID=1463920 RepID=UPI0007C454AA|nr:DUF6098 family protein [Streptomyces sp. NRRL S-87]